MRFQLNIDYPAEKMEQNRKRLEAWGRFRYVDRVPILYGIFPRFFAPLFGLRYLDFFKDVETHYYWQLQFAKYRIENIPEDFCCSPAIGVHPYFDNVIQPSSYGGKVGWEENNPPRMIPVIKTVEQMERFEVPGPEAGLRGKAIEWWRKMKDLAAETKVTFNGQEIRVDVGILGLGGLSPHMIAVDLVGGDFYWWIKEYPEACHRFLEKITRGEIASEENTRRIDPRPRGESYCLAEDSAQIMSAQAFREFCVPYSRAIFDRFGRQGRGIHMCGNSAHLHQVLKDDLKMTSFELFGYLVSPKVVAANLGGTTLLHGNIDPMLMQGGTPQQVKEAARECLEVLGPCGGYLLSEGANVCPGTPLENFRVIMEAAEEYGLGNGKLLEDK